MRTARASLTVASLLLLGACGGSDGAPGATGAAGAAGKNGAPGRNGGANADAGAPPAHGPAGITFFDDDPGLGGVSGTIIVKHAAVESDVTSYAVYFGKSATAKLDLTPIFSEAPDGADIMFPLTMNPIPAGASFLLAVAQNAAGESTAVATHLDAVPARIDISAGAGATSGIAPKMAIDTANGKLLVATEDDSNSSKPSLLRCNIDGASCVRFDMSGGAGPNSGNAPSLVIDAATGELFIATDDASNNNKPALFVLR